MTAPHPEHLTGEDGEFLTAFNADTPKKQTGAYISWVEWLYETRPGKLLGEPGMFLLLAVGVYVSGLLVAAMLNTVPGYTRSPAILLEVVGIPMVITGIHRLTRGVRAMLADIGQIAAEPEEYHSYVAYWKRKMASIEITLIALMGTVLFTIVIVGAVNIVFDLGEGPFRAGMMSPDLLRYSYQMILHSYLILLIGVALSELFKLVFGTIWLMRTLRPLPVVDDRERVVQHTQSILQVSMTGGLVWTLAAVFFGILLADTVSAGEFVVMYLLMLPGLGLVVMGIKLVRKLRLRAGYGKPPFAAAWALNIMLAAAILSPLLSVPVQQVILSVIAPGTV